MVRTGTAFTATSIPWFRTEPALAKVELNKFGGVGTVYENNKSVVFLLYTSIEPPKRLSNTLQSKPTLNSVDFSQRRSGFGLELTDKPGNHLPSL